jgi:predicted RND superfamily exporter protein
MLTGFIGFALFCFTLAVSLRTLGVAAAFVVAVVAALLTQTALIRRSRANSVESEEPPAILEPAASEP